MLKQIKELVKGSIIENRGRLFKVFSVEHMNHGNFIVAFSGSGSMEYIRFESDNETITAYPEGLQLKHLQGIGSQIAKEAKDLKVNDIVMWNFGSTSIIKNIEFSKSGKTLVITFEDGGNRKFRATSLVAIEYNETTEDNKINDLSVEENKNTMEGEKMKEITIDFANIISELKNKNLNIVFLKNRNAIFIEDNKNNLYVIEDNFVGSYLDTLILKGKKVVFHLTDSKIGKEIGEWEVSKRRNFKKIEDFIKDSSNFWSKEEKDIAEKILKKGNNKSIRIESEFEDYVLNTEDNNEFTEGENMDNIRYFKSTDPGHKDFIVIEGNKSIKKHLTGSTVWKVDTQKDVIKDYGHKDVNAYINHLKKFNYVEVFEDIKEDSEEVIGVENKELYEVTKKEYLNNIYQTLEGVQKHKWEEQIKNNKVDDFSFLSKCLAKHKVSIINAIWEGKNVSIEVLKDYPEIQEEFKKEIEENKITISSDAEPSNIDCKSLKNNFNSNIPIY